MDNIRNEFRYFELRVGWRGSWVGRGLSVFGEDVAEMGHEFFDEEVTAGGVLLTTGA